MSEQAPAPGKSGDEPASEADVVDEAHEADLMRAVMRRQEEHREGGVDPELLHDSDPGSEADA